MDSRLLAPVLLAKIPSPHKTMQLTFGPGMFVNIGEGSLLVVHLMENLRDAVARAVEDSFLPSMQDCSSGGSRSLDSNDALIQMNLSLRCVWASTTIKPWTGGISRTDDGNFITASIPQIADRIDQALQRLP